MFWNQPWMCGTGATVGSKMIAIGCSTRFVFKSFSSGWRSIHNLLNLVALWGLHIPQFIRQGWRSWPVIWNIVTGRKKRILLKTWEAWSACCFPRLHPQSSMLIYLNLLFGDLYSHTMCMWATMSLYWSRHRISFTVPGDSIDNDNPSICESLF